MTIDYLADARAAYRGWLARRGFADLTRRPVRRRRPRHALRDATIARQYARGASRQALAARYQLSCARIRQIVTAAGQAKA